MENSLIQNSKFKIREYQKINYPLCRGADGARQLRFYIMTKVRRNPPFFGASLQIGDFLIGSSLEEMF